MGHPLACHSSYASAAIVPSSTVSVRSGLVLGSLVTDVFGSILSALLDMITLQIQFVGILFWDSTSAIFRRL